MKIFGFLQATFKLVGIQPLEPFQTHLPVDSYFKIFLTILFLMLNICSAIAFILIEAKTLIEQIESFWLAVVTTATLVPYVVFVIIMERIFKLIDCFEKLIDERQ